MIALVNLPSYSVILQATNITYTRNMTEKGLPHKPSLENTNQELKELRGAHNHSQAISSPLPVTTAQNTAWFTPSCQPFPFLSHRPQPHRVSLPCPTPLIHTVLLVPCFLYFFLSCPNIPSGVWERALSYWCRHSSIYPAHPISLVNPSPSIQTISYSYIVNCINYLLTQPSSL